MADVEFAPAAIVRVAGWPLGAVKGLRDAALATMACSVTPESKEWQAYLASYSEALDRQRRVLWQRTVDDPRFVRALALATPNLAKSILGREFPVRRNKAVRHLETTLYRYLSRAVSRTEPCGMWTGATLARWSMRRRIRATAAAACRVAPDLAPFRAICACLAERAPYVDHGPYKLNPTLVRRPDHSYLLWSGPGRGPSTQRRLAATAVLDRIIATLEEQALWTRPDAVAALVEHAGLSRGAAHGVIEQFCTAGVMVGGFAFPRHFSDPWDALRTVEQRLEPEDASAWREARIRLEGLTQDLVDVLHDCEASTIIEAMEAACTVVEALARALEVEGLKLPRTALRCDVAAPWDVELGVDDAQLLRRSISAYTRYQDSDGMHPPLLRASIRQMLGTTSGGGLAQITPAGLVAAPNGVVTWDALAASLGGDDDLVARSERMRRHIDTWVPEVWIHPAGRDIGPALAAVHASLTHAELGGRPLVHGVVLDATSAYSRLADLLDAEDNGGLGRWFRHQYCRVAERLGVDFAALLYDHPNPNVMAQPALMAGVVDPWGVTPGQLSDRGLHLRVDAEQRWPVVTAAGRERPLVLLAPTAASPPTDDPCLHALLLSSQHIPPVQEPRARMVHSGELEQLRHGPRVRLDDGTTIRTRRTWLHGETLKALTQTKGATRFAAWRRLAVTHDWPDLLLVQRDGGPPLLVDRDSPLAIEAAFEGARATKLLHIEEFVRDAWIGDDHDTHDRHHKRHDDDDSRRYVADLVLPFVRDLDPARVSPVVDGLDPAQCGACSPARLVATE